MRHGPADRRDDDGNLPGPAARTFPVRAVLVHRRRGAAGIRRHPAPARPGGGRSEEGGPDAASARCRSPISRPGIASACSTRSSRPDRARRGGSCARARTSPAPGVEFYDPEKVCAAAPLRDNLLFGRVSYRVANAQARVAEAISAVVRRARSAGGYRAGRPRPSGRHSRAAADRAGAGERQSGPLPREASRIFS